MDIRSAETAMRRARKRLAHAVSQAAEAATPRAKARHARRERIARKALLDAVRGFEAMAFEGA